MESTDVREVTEILEDGRRKGDVQAAAYQKQIQHSPQPRRLGNGCCW